MSTRTTRITQSYNYNLFIHLFMCVGGFLTIF